MASTSSYNFKTIICFNLLGFTLFFSWYLPENHGFWFKIDASIFYFFNQLLVASPSFADFVAIVNHRAFDLIAFVSMGSLLLYFYVQQDAKFRRRLFFMGVTMLLCAIVINQLGRMIPVVRPSPTLLFTPIQRIMDLTDIGTKDASGDSFPGDHGTMLLIFSGFILRYFTRKAFVLALALMILFSLPRIMIGAHWFTDVYVGSVALVCVLLSWFLYTPASDYVIDGLNRFFPGKNRPEQHDVS